MYDIRHPYRDPTPPKYFNDFLNLPDIQQALGVDLNYTQSNNDVFYAFQKTGDFAYPNFLDELEEVLNNSVRVALIYGDADYICNWFGGEAVSNEIRYTHSKEFAKTGYVPFVVDGTEYGEVRQYGNLSFLRVYEAGHEVPFYQPLASLEYFKRTLDNTDIATGKIDVTGDYATNGTAKATHTEPYVPLPPPTSTASATATTRVNATETGRPEPEQPKVGHPKLQQPKPGFGTLKFGGMV